MLDGLFQESKLRMVMTFLGIVVWSDTRSDYIYMVSTFMPINTITLAAVDAISSPLACVCKD